MAISLNKIKAGDVLLDVHSERAGNTMMRRVGVWRVKVISVDATSFSAMVSWNGNPPKRWYSRRLRKLRRFAPEWMASDMWSREGRFYCHHCHAKSDEKDSSKHEDDCPHPKAVAWRKKQARAAKSSA